MIRIGGSHWSRASFYMLIFCSTLITDGCSRGPAPPVAKQAATTLEKHGHRRTDEYFWLKDRDNPEVIRYLEAENAYFEAMMAHTKPLQETLFREFKTRIKQTDESVPYRKDGYFYYSRMVEGKDYPLICRKKGALEAPEELMLDVNQAAEGHKFYSIGKTEVSTGGHILGYTADTVGRRFYTLRFKNLATGAELAGAIPDTTGNFVWANDDKTVFYTRQHPETLRSYRVYRHTLGTDPAADTLVYEETDETFSCTVAKTKSKKYILIASSQTLSDEYRYLDASQPDGKFQVFLARQRKHEYGIDHYGGHFFIRTNRDATNFRLMKTPVGSTAMNNWTEVVPHRADTFVEDFDIFKEYLVVTERRGGLTQIRVMPWSSEEHYVKFDEPAYAVEPMANFEFDTPLLRYHYSSLTTPPSTYDYDMRMRTAKLLKRDEVLGGFDQANYQTERVNVPARDGTLVPVSLVYRKGFKKDGSAPLLQYGYGSYGISMSARFDPYVISLLDRGFVYAIAHIRGGQELGRPWYEGGKLLNKKNTFTDFIDCAEYLIREKFGDPKRMFARGGSAGGLLMGAVMTMRPELFTGIIADVPFVDVVTTMLDDSIPLTTSEYDEWGNPNDKPYYDYMLSYSPYDQMKPAAYPHLLVTTGLHDSQVQYWEPAKWVARLRALKRDDHRLLLRTEMKAGHGGLTSRDDRYRETAFRYAFLLDIAGIRN